MSNFYSLNKAYNKLIQEETNPELSVIVEAEQFIKKYQELKEQGFAIIDKLKQTKSANSTFSEKADQLLDIIVGLNFQ